MRKLYLSLLLALGLCSVAQAIDRPKTPAGAPKNGKEYILVSAYTTDGYMAPTSWDTALYFLGEDDSDYENNAFTAILNDDGTWCFVYYTYTETTDDDGETVTDTTIAYVGVPSTTSTCNVWSSLSEEVRWTVQDGNIDDFYWLIPASGGQTNVIGLPMHLNSNGQYFVISEEEDGGTYYPDYAGGGLTDDYGEYVLDENERVIFADSTSWNWAFIDVEDVPEWMALYEAYDAITLLEEEYVAIDGYEDGFNATLTAVLAIWESDDFDWLEHCETIVNMIEEKYAFYEAIEDAKAYDDADVALLAAIANAESAFITATTVSDIEAGIEALQDAIDAFEQGTGNLTGMGQNMSFEDLSSQDGVTVTGVAAPPTGWNVYIDGVQVTTADEVSAAGVTGWHGINEDATGEIDGDYAFGIWTSGVPTYEISQTIEGLETGTYTISAALMVGANSYGSRRTTQRIFGNYNAAYFGSEGEYDEDELDVPEVASYAGLEEPTTDTQLQGLSVRAYVYDGTLTFGVKTAANITAALRTSSNSAGGDGWFKVDNFTIQSEGYVAADAAEVANYFYEAIFSRKNDMMYAELTETVNELLSTYSSVSSSTDSATINEMIRVLAANLDAVVESVDAYADLEDYLYDTWEEAAESYAYYSGYSEFEEYMATIEEAWADGTLTTQEAIDAISEISEQLQALILSGVAVGEYLNVIVNASFEDLSNQSNTTTTGAAAPPAGWSLYINGIECTSTGDYSSAGASLGWCGINGGDDLTSSAYGDPVNDDGETISVQYTDGSYLWGIWATDMPEVELSQVISGLPAGTYILSADLMVQYDWAYDNTTTQRIFANKWVELWGEEDFYEEDYWPEDVATAAALDADNPDSDVPYLTYAGYVCDEEHEGVCNSLRPMSITFGLDGESDLTLGMRTDGTVPNSTSSDGTTAGQGWFKVDNFQLFWESEDIPTAINSTSISGNAAEVLGQQFYTVDGARVKGIQKGITLVKTLLSDGTVKTTKVFR